MSRAEDPAPASVCVSTEPDLSYGARTRGTLVGGLCGWPGGRFARPGHHCRVPSGSGCALPVLDAAAALRWEWPAPAGCRKRSAAPDGTGPPSVSDRSDGLDAIPSGVPVSSVSVPCVTIHSECDWNGQ